MISVIIPTYNRRELLLRAIDSVLAQTHAELECIVVDDASTDGTQSAVLDLQDDRVRYVRQPQRRGACAARNRGVDMAQGEYIAFQDSDDVWHGDKLEKQLALLEASGADVVVCAMHRMLPDKKYEVFPKLAVDAPLKRPALLLENLCSTQCIMGRAEVFRDVRFDEELPRLQDWDLMLRVSRKYRVHMGCTPLVDVYVQPDSISQQPGKLLAALRRMYGRFHGEITGEGMPLVHQERIDLRWISAMVRAAERCGEEPFDQQLLENAPDWVYRRGEAAAWQRIRILMAGGTLEESFMPGTQVLYMALEGFHPAPGVKYLPAPLLEDVLRCCGGSVSFDGRWADASDRHGHLAGAIRAMSAQMGMRQTWDILSRVHGGTAVAAELAASQLMHMDRWAGALTGLDMPVRGGKVRRVGVYYHSLKNGGVQQTAAALIREWVRMGYEVTLITTQAASDEDYDVPDPVVRRIIPPFDHRQEAVRRAHVRELVRVAKGCDVLVYHAWADPMILWDLLAVRSVGTRFIVHTHSVFTMPLLESTMMDRFMALPDVYALADGVVTLSETDRCYWGQVNARVYATVNPLTFTAAETPVHTPGSRNLLWVGRLSPEKRPMDAVFILKQAVREMPHLHLTILGGGDEATLQQLRTAITANGLDDRVTLAGFHKDVRPYYEQADLLLCTSAYEGYCLSIVEAATFGVPCVTYDMPYLTTLQGGGYVSVRQGDVDAAARAAVRILGNGAYRSQLGRQARERVETRLNVDQRAIWQRIFDDQQRTLPPMMLHNSQSVMLRTLREHMALRCSMASRAPVQTYQTAFVPMPEKGPCKTLRKKAATFLQVLLVEGFSGVGRIIREKRSNRA